MSHLAPCTTAYIIPGSCTILNKSLDLTTIFSDMQEIRSFALNLAQKDLQLFIECNRKEILKKKKKIDHFTSRFSIFVNEIFLLCIGRKKKKELILLSVLFRDAAFEDFDLYLNRKLQYPRPS